MWVLGKTTPKRDGPQFLPSSLLVSLLPGDGDQGEKYLFGFLKGSTHQNIDKPFLFITLYNVFISETCLFQLTNQQITKQIRFHQ